MWLPVSTLTVAPPVFGKCATLGRFREQNLFPNLENDYTRVPNFSCTKSGNTSAELHSRVAISDSQWWQLLHRVALQSSHSSSGGGLQTPRVLWLQIRRPRRALNSPFDYVMLHVASAKFRSWCASPFRLFARTHHRFRLLQITRLNHATFISKLVFFVGPWLLPLFRPCPATLAQCGCRFRL